MTTPYCPISCETHDQLLELATLRRTCVLAISTGNAAEPVSGIIVDVYSAQGAEYLRLKDGRTYRLDEIQALIGHPTSRP